MIAVQTGFSDQILEEKNGKRGGLMKEIAEFYLLLSRIIGNHPEGSALQARSVN